MNKVVGLIFVACLVVAGCMAYLLKTGISLSPAVLIKPSLYQNEERIIAAAVMRLFPQLSQIQNWTIVFRIEHEEKVAKAVALAFKRSHANINVNVVPMLDPQLKLSDGKNAVLYIQQFHSDAFELKENCQFMQRLNYNCFVQVSLHKARRKMKPAKDKYFLLTAYLEKNFLLLIEKNAKNSNHKN